MGGRGKLGVRGRSRALLGARGAAAGPQRSVTMKPLMALVLAVMTVVRVLGTAQEPDKLILDGKEVELFENPLEAFWPDGQGRPNIETVGLPREEIIISSNNWRGYVAEWAIRGDRLFLTDLSRRCGIPKWRAWMKPWADDEYRSVPMELVLPGKKLPVFAEWYSGRLKIPQGKMTRYVHMGYGSEYERELLIEIKNGVVVGRAEISNAGRNEFRSVPDLEWCALGQGGRRQRRLDRCAAVRHEPVA